MRLRRGVPPRRKYYTDKVPLIESIYAWIDVFCHMTYNRKIKETAYYYITQYVSKHTKIQHPSAMAVVAINMACDKEDEIFDYPRMNSILHVYLTGIKLKRGLPLMSKITEMKNEWKSELK